MKVDLPVLFRAFVEQYPQLMAASHVGVAVSGGGDSMALACLAREVWSRVTLLHMNYGLRGDESDRDEEAVRRQAGILGCEFVAKRVSPQSRAEDELRRLRYNWFQEFPGDAILTGHSLDDQAETLLFRIIRGTGISGLAGIQPVRDDRIYRPLLEASRSDIRAWLTHQNMVWREDASNADLAYRRNWIRHHLLPQLTAELNPEATRALAQLSAIVRDEEAWITPYVARLLDVCVAPEGASLVVDCQRLREHPHGLRRRILRQVFERVKGDLLEIEFPHIEAALQLAEESEGNGRLQIPGLDLMRSFGWLRVISLETLANLPVRNFRRPFPVPTRIEVPEDAGILQSFLDTGCNYNEIGTSLDWEKVSAASDDENRLELRNWRPGDSYIRFGSSHPEKVKELFQKYKVPLWRRRAWPIVVLRDLPVWVAEFGPAVDFAAGIQTRTALHLKWSPPWAI